jgi:hypothetical protein
MLKSASSLIAVATLLAAGLHGHAFGQAYKCTINGSAVYQQRPCEESGGKGAAMKLQVATPNPPAERASAPTTTPAAPAPVPVAAVPPAAPEKPKKSWVERRADECLNWYRPRLRDPRSAYYQDASDDKGILTFTIYATNGFGGFASRTAACEFVSGVLDDSWTKIHAKRNGW